MNMTNLINCLGTLFSIMALGFLCSKVGLLKEANKKVLSDIVVNIALPGMIVDAVLNTDVDLSSPSTRELLVALAVYYVAFAVLARLFVVITSRKHPDRGVHEYMAMFGNSGFLGIPLITAMFGEEALFYVASFVAPYHILSFTYGIYLIRGGNKDEKFSWKSMLTPPAVTSVVSLALLLMGVKLPVFLADAAGYVSSITVPGAMLVVGASLATIPGGKIWRDWRIYANTAYMLLLRPVILAVLLKLFISDPLVWGVTVVLSAVPAGATGTSLCVTYHANEKLASCGVFISTLLSMLTIPLIALLLL